MFNKILIANRGEIACRIIKTARRMGISCVAVYSDADRHALHVTLADEALYIGTAPATESYLNMDAIITAAQRSQATAIHPGYGFLSESAIFCQRCIDAGLHFIGPPPAAIETMGSKAMARRLMTSSGVPLLPGYDDTDQTPATLKNAADKIGYPVLIKASAGGGGKGMRKVNDSTEFAEQLAAAQREASKAFGDERIMLEKYLPQARHVEVQVFCDQHGNAVYLADRDCSVQRRHQKIIEEAPAPGLSDALRSKMGKAALRCCKAIDYVGAGTIEFLLTEDKHFYFMEMNTRLQVEHTVSEMITGIDLVEWQLRVASGEPLPITRQSDITVQGHAFEARIYAEDPENDFLPASGLMHTLDTPEENHHVRIDSGVMAGDTISVFYDPMIAKLITWDDKRQPALQRLGKALSQYRIGGISNNVEFLYNLSMHPAFQDAELDIHFIPQHQDELFGHSNNRDPSLLLEQLQLAGLLLMLKQQQQVQQLAKKSADLYSPWHDCNAWRLNEHHQQTLEILIDEEAYTLHIEQLPTPVTDKHKEMHFALHTCDTTAQFGGSLNGSLLKANIDGHRKTYTVAQQGERFILFTETGARHFTLPLKSHDIDDSNEVENTLSAPMHGCVVALLAKPGVKLQKGDALLVMEAMKMEHTLRAPCDGEVTRFLCQPGELVEGGQELIEYNRTEQQIDTDTLN